MEEPDTALMALSAKGSERAFAELVDRYKNPLLNFFLRQGLPFYDAQDLAQRTFIRIWRYRRKYRPAAKFTTFLFMAARQESIDHFRSETRRNAMKDGFAREMSAKADSAGAAAPADGIGDAALHAFRSLPDGLRATVELVVLQGLPQADAAEILSIPLGTVKSRLFNALRRLRAALSGAPGATRTTV